MCAKSSSVRWPRKSQREPTGSEVSLTRFLSDSERSNASTNAQGETQKEFALIANEMLIEANECGATLAAVASEEIDEPVGIPVAYARDRREPDKAGMLRLMCEANPIAWLFQ